MVKGKTVIFKLNTKQTLKINTVLKTEQSILP